MGKRILSALAESQMLIDPPGLFRIRSPAESAVVKVGTVR